MFGRTIPPDDSWNLSRLAKFCRDLIRRSAIDAWYIGKAVSIARDKHKVEHDWLAWIKAEVEMSQRSAYRYIEIHRQLDFSELPNLSLNDAHKLAVCRHTANRSKSSWRAKRPQIFHELVTGLDLVCRVAPQADLDVFTDKELRTLHARLQPLLDMAKLVDVRLGITRASA